MPAPVVNGGAFLRGFVKQNKTVQVIHGLGRKPQEFLSTGFFGKAETVAIKRQSSSSNIRLKTFLSLSIREREGVSEARRKGKR